ncbi:MAG: hypothetical protein Q7S59_05850 [Sulfurimonas sp.]|nr:hypothetical protein [Sulfurimonas sp.]
MAKSMIRNKLGEKTLTLFLPAGATEAQAFCDTCLDGETAVFQAMTTVGSDVVTTARDVNVMISNLTTGEKGYLSFLIEETKHEGDVISALLNKTFNGVKAERVVVVSMRTVNF